MLNRGCILFVVISAFALPVAAGAGQVGLSLEFSINDLTVTESDSFAQILLAGCELTDHIGSPQVPVKVVSLVLPRGSRVDSVQVVETASKILPGLHLVHPAQPQRMMGLESPADSLVPPEMKVYGSANAYPGTVAEPAGTGICGDYQLAEFLVYPVQYHPQSRTLEFSTRINLVVHYTAGDMYLSTPRQPVMTDSATRRELIRRMVDNPEDVDRWAASTALVRIVAAPSDYEYLIVTSPELAPAFAPLAQWKTRKGVPAAIVTTDSIYAVYEGADHAARVRNFIKDAYVDHGITWVLLGGDTANVPLRKAFAMDAYYGGLWGPDVPTDLYYADLDGTWDGNFDGVYGETDDNVDLYPDVFVGRVACHSYDEAENWVNKLLAYEIDPATDYQLRMLFMAQWLWLDPKTDGANTMELIEDMYVPDRFDPIGKLYESWNNLNYGDVMAALNSGPNIINHAGWGEVEYFNLSEDVVAYYDLDSLVNDPRYSSLFYSMGSYFAAFDERCLAEHFIANPDGGGVAAIGNSRYGWSLPGNPTYGVSERLNQSFFAALFDEDIHHLGTTLARSKLAFIPLSRHENAYRMCQYQLNLLGDPEMPLWTDIPRQLAVSHPEAIPATGGEFTITVLTGEETGDPVTEAMVCLSRDDDVYLRATTGPDGVTRISVPPSSGGLLNLTVTARNCIPYQAEVLSGSVGAYIDCREYAIDDLVGGNGNGTANPGETIRLSLTVENYGDEQATNLRGFLHSHADEYISLIDSVLEFGDVPGGAAATSITTALLDIDSTASDRHVALFDWLLVDDEDRTYAGVIGLQIAQPDLFLYHYAAFDSAGNDNGVPDPGETCMLRVWLKNRGLEQAGGVSATVLSNDPMVTVVNGPVSFGGITAGEMVAGDFTVEINPLCQTPYFVSLPLVLSLEDGHIIEDSFILTIGPTGLFDDMESVAPGWLHYGTPDSWTITDHRGCLSARSWYCGDTAVWAYENNADCRLETPPVVLGPESCLSFCYWFESPNVGGDGCRVMVTDYVRGVVETLDFISLGSVVDYWTDIYTTGWIRVQYDLSDYPAGTLLGVSFSFVSDGDDVGEGLYIDDVRIRTRPEYDPFLDPTESQRFGTQTDTISHLLRVENRGFWPDSYDLQISGGAWAFSVWDSGGEIRISDTGPLEPNAYRKILVKIAVPESPLGTVDTAVLSAVSSADPNRQARTRLITSSEGKRGTTPWVDDFLAAELDSIRWRPSDSMVIVTSSPLFEPTLPFAARLLAGQSMTTQEIDLFEKSDLRVGFCIMQDREGAWWVYNDITVEYYAAEGNWATLLATYILATYQSSYEEYVFDLPPDAYHARFRLRFRTDTELYLTGAWYVDDVYIGPPRDINFAFHTREPASYGAAGREAAGLLIIENRGQVADRYNLAATGGDWPFLFREGANAITQTEPVLPGDSAMVVVVAQIPAGTPALAAETALVLITSDGEAGKYRQAEIYHVCTGEIGIFPWIDGFAETTIPNERWPIPTGANITALGDKAPSPPNVLYVSNNHVVCSQKIDLSGTDAAMLDFVIRPVSYYQLPRLADSAIFEYVGADGEWRSFYVLYGDGRWHESFTRYSIELPLAALHPGFQMRIKLQAPGGPWYIDDVGIVAPPVCRLTEEMVEMTLDPGQQGATSVIIENPGAGQLDFGIQIIPLADTMNLPVHQTAIVPLVPNAQEDEAPVPDLHRCAIDGPDKYGYLWVDSDEPYGPAFVWDDIAEYGIPLDWISPTMYETFQLAFPFPYYDTSYTELLVSRKGALQFGVADGVDLWMPIIIPYPFQPDNILAWCWGNHNSLGTVHAYSDNQRAVIQFAGFGDSTNAPGWTGTAQVILTVDGDISYRYLSFGADFYTSECSVGIESPGGTDGLGVVFFVNSAQSDPQYLHDSLRIDFYRPRSWLAVDPAGGTVAPGGEQPIMLNFRADNFIPGSYDAYLRVNSNDPDVSSNPARLAVRLTVNETAVCYCPMGDLDLSGNVTAIDAVILINYVLRGGPVIPDHPQCPYQLADVKFDEIVNILDVIYLINYVYRAGPPPDNPCP